MTSIFQFYENYTSSFNETFEWSAKVTLHLIDSSSSINLSLSPYMWLLAPLSRYLMFSLACIRSSYTSNKVAFFYSSTIKLVFSSIFQVGFQQSLV